MTSHLKSLRARAAAAVVAMLFAAQGAWAVEPFKVQDIRVEGLQRIEPGTVFASLPVRVGDVYDDEKGAASIRALFALGLFKDVRLEVSDGLLVVVVEERPTVASIEFSGSKEFDADTLRKSLRDIGLMDGRPFDRALADRAEQELKRQYINRSLYGAEVVTTVTPVAKNQVNLTFTVTEGQPARIKEIRIVGNQAFSESTLKDLFDLDTGGWLSWYTKSDRYSRAKLNADTETLKSYYLARGYLEFRIESTQVAISPNKQDIAITLTVSEGQRYRVAGVKMEGNFLDREDEFKSLVAIKPGEPYNADLAAQTSKAFSDYFGTFGYAFARVEIQPQVDREKGLVDLIIQGDPGRRAYVRRINVEGNSRTRDEVIRREFRQYEASWYDGDRIRLSRDKVDRLGYFQEVSFDTVEVPGTTDQVDLTVKVSEKPTGSLQLGAGFSSAEKLSLTFGIKQENAFGSGNYLGFDVNTSKFNRVFSISTTDPYFTKDGVSRSVDLFHRSTKPYTDLGGNYELVTTGAGLKFGVPFTEQDRVFFGWGVERTELKPGTNVPAAYVAYAAQYGYSSFALPLTLGWSRDDRDSALTPNKGRYQRLNSEWGVGADSRYLRANYQYQEYIPLSKQFTLAFYGELGWGKGLSGRPFPVFKNFYSGGLGSVRGFETGTLGPRDVTGSLVGGPKKITLNAEVITPFPGAGNDRTLRMFGFVDVGNAFGQNEKIRFSEMRASVGVGLSWISPLGPLRFAYAAPVRKFAGDRIQRLQFQIGTSF